MIEKKKHKIIEEDRVLELLKRFEKSKEPLEMKYIKFYHNKKLVEKIMKIVDENITVEVNTIEDYQRAIKIYNNVIYEYINQQQYIGEKRLPQDITLSKINKIRDLINNNNYMKIRRILKIEEFDALTIKKKAEDKIRYWEYIRQTEIDKRESDIKNYRRIVNNKIENITNKHLDKRNGEPPDETPSEEETYEYWNNLLGYPSEIDEEHENLQHIRNDSHLNFSPVNIQIEDVQEAIRGIPNWKCPGNDGIQGYYIKYARKYHVNLLRIYMQWLDDPNTIPSEYMKGNTTLIYKGGNPMETVNYRPITCINIITKIYTSILKHKILQQLSLNTEDRQISFCQLGNKHLSLGAKEGIIANKIIQEKQNSLGTKYIEAYYDVKKAFDSVNHVWLLRTLEYYNIPLKIIDNIEHMMNNWKIKPKYDKDSNIQEINMKRGIMQGDSLSPLLFILYIDIVSHQLNEKIKSIEITDTNETETVKAHINHFFYVDDLKIIVNEAEEAAKAHELIKQTMKAIGLEINVRKCGITLHDIEAPENMQEIPVVDNINPYRYLGIPTGHNVVTEAAIAEIMEKIKGRLTELKEKEQSSVNYIQRIKATVLGLLRYSFATIDWPICQLTKIDDLIRKSLTEAGMYGRGLSKPRLYVSREELGHGLPCIRDEYGIELLRVLIHYAWTEDKKTAAIIHQEKNMKNSLTKKINKVLKKKISLDEIITITKKYEEKRGDKKKLLVKLIQEIQKKIEQYYITEWKKQKVAGELRRQFEQEHIDRKTTGEAWRKFNIKRTAYLMVARMQENSTMNGNKKALITGIPEAKFCKFCTNQIATNNHILLSCKLNKRKQIAKHDYLAERVFRKFELKKGFENTTPIEHYRRDGEKHMLWNTNVVSSALGDFPKRPDICYRDKQTIIVMDAAIVADHNVNKVYLKKINKYEDLTQFFREVQPIKEKIIVPIIMSVNGLIHAETVKMLKKLKINIDWTTTVRNILARNMIDLMYYNGVNISDDITDIEVDEDGEADIEQIRNALFQLFN